MVLTDSSTLKVFTARAVSVRQVACATRRVREGRTGGGHSMVERGVDRRTTRLRYEPWCARTDRGGSRLARLATEAAIRRPA